MATNSKMDMNFVEKLGDGFNRFTEGIVGFMTRLFGSSNERQIRANGHRLALGNFLRYANSTPAVGGAERLDRTGAEGDDDPGLHRFDLRDEVSRARL